MEKKKKQLGIHPSTASNRLIKDLLYRYISYDSVVCHQCGEPMTRDTFSVEHKIPWLDSDDPAGMFYDLSNIAYSHLACNIAAIRRKKSAAKCGTKARYSAGCRCVECKSAEAAYKRANYTTESRRAKYLKHGY